MNIRNAIRHYRTIAVIPAITAVAVLASMPANADLDDTTTYSALGCVAQDPKQQGLLLPTSKGLKNRSTTETVAVFCPLQRSHASVVTCAAAQNHRFTYKAYFSISPQVSGSKAARVSVIRTLPTWANEQAQSSLASYSLPLVVKRSASSPDPLADWDGFSKYTTHVVSVTLGCSESSQEYAPNMRLHIPPKGYATALQTVEFRERN